MKASAVPFLHLLNAPRQFSIPVFQRHYSWKIEQCDQLFKDIHLAGSRSDHPGHFIGSAVFIQDGIAVIAEAPQFMLIDGQQRMTSITLLLAAITEFATINQTSIDAERIRDYYLINKHEKEDLRHKLLLTKRDKDTLRDIASGVVTSTRKPEYQNSQRVWENYLRFFNQLTPDNVEAIYAGIQRLIIVQVVLEKDVDDPQLIFESMNATGMDLSQADLIRNFMLMDKSAELQADLYYRYWYPMEMKFGDEHSTRFDSFMRDFLSVRTGKIPSIEKVYEEFKGMVKKALPKPSTADLAKDIHKLADHYVNLTMRKEPDPTLRLAFVRLSEFGVDVANSFLLRVYEDYTSGQCNTEEFAEIVGIVESYLFRRAVCSIPTNSHNKTFATLHKSIRTEKYLESVKAAFLLLDNYKRFPDDVEFSQALMSRDVYRFRLRNILLDNLENYGRKERVNISEYTIEHVIPQNPKLRPEWQEMLGENWKDVQDKYLHTLGNLTLTRYNPELSDRAFEVKKSIEGGFNDSPLKLNDYLQGTEVWTESQILDRASVLTQKAIKIWVRPDLPVEILQTYGKEHQEIKPYSLDDYEYLKDDRLTMFTNLRKRIMNLDTGIAEVLNKQYIAYRGDNNFAGIIVQKERLVIALSVERDRLTDPHNKTEDISDVGNYFNGRTRLFAYGMDDLDYAMDLITQAYRVQEEAEEVD